MDSFMSGRTMHWFRWLMAGIALLMLISYINSDKVYGIWAWAIMLGIWLSTAIYKCWFDKGKSGSVSGDK